MSNEGKKRSKYPLRHTQIRAKKIDEILDKYKSEYRKKCKHNNLSLRKSELMREKPDTPNMFGALLDECEESKCDDHR
jgi:hypothetical protein